jgi:imidazolonepropionase-like amidohydrolase
MAEAGLTPRQILRAATADAARCMGLDGQVGTLEPGAWADLLVLAGDPLDDIANLHRIDAVYIAGNAVPGVR